MFKTIRNIKMLNKIVDWVIELKEKYTIHQADIKKLKNKVQMLIDDIKELKGNKVENANSTPTM